MDRVGVQVQQITAESVHCQIDSYDIIGKVGTLLTLLNYLSGCGGEKDQHLKILPIVQSWTENGTHNNGCLSVAPSIGLTKKSLLFVEKTV